MKFLMHKVGLAAGVLALGMMGSAGAQENLDQGKSGAQLFASDCAICHKTTAGLSKGQVLGLDNFLREHYTASRESAAIIAAYIASTDKGAAPAASARTKKKDAGKDDKLGNKPGDTKGDKTGGDKTGGGTAADKKSDEPSIIEKLFQLPGDAPPAESKPAAAKPAKPAGAKPSEAKPSASKPAADKPAADKPAADKPAAEKPADPKPGDGQPADIYKPEKKSE